jgi:hypothetical protein
LLGRRSRFYGTAKSRESSLFRDCTEVAGYKPIPWATGDKHDEPLDSSTEAGSKMADDSDSDSELYGGAPRTAQKEDVKREEHASSGDEPMDEESGDDSDESVCRMPATTTLSYAQS